MVVGAISLDPVLDALGILCEYEEAFPQIAASDWEPSRQIYPELFRDESWWLPTTCYLVRSEGVTILVDTGVGPPGLRDWTAEEEGLLPESLAALDVRAEDVDVVFFTHLHTDHVGWNADLDGVPIFSRARHVVHGDGLEEALQHDWPHVRRCIAPLADGFERVRGECELAPGVTAFETPGHYPGHMAVRIDSAGARATILGDAIVHPAFLDHPEWSFAFDADDQTARRTRAALVADLVDDPGLVVCGHYPGTGIGRLATRDSLVTWEAAA